MLLRKGISFVAAFALVTMMVCPAAVASPLVKVPKSASHCDTETPAVPQQKETMQCCCDQIAIPVQELHAPFDSVTFEVLHPVTGQLIPIYFAFDFARVPYLKTGDHLADLSALRL